MDGIGGSRALDGAGIRQGGLGIHRFGGIRRSGSVSDVCRCHCVSSVFKETCRAWPAGRDTKNSACRCPSASLPAGSMPRSRSRCSTCSRSPSLTKRRCLNVLSSSFSVTYPQSDSVASMGSNSQSRSTKLAIQGGSPLVTVGSNRSKVFSVT